VSDTEWYPDDAPDGDEDLSSWLPVDLSATVKALLSGVDTRLKPTVGRLGDGRGLFYRGRVNVISGASGDGKTWCTLAVVAQEIEAGNHAVYVDLEDSAEGIVSRLLNLGIESGVILSRFHYVSPQDRYDNRHAAMFQAMVGQWNPSLVVIDSVGEALALQGLDPNSDKDVTDWHHRLPRFIASLGPCVLLTDHVPKNQNDTLFSIGSHRKRAAPTGASYMLRTKEEFSTQQAGYATLTVAKDRLGIYTRNSTVARLSVAPLGGGKVRVALSGEDGSSNGGPWKPTECMEKVSLFLEGMPDRSSDQKTIAAGVAMKKETVLDAINHLQGDGYLTITRGGGVGKPNIHHLDKIYRREHGDDDLGSAHRVPSCSPPIGGGNTGTREKPCSGNTVGTRGNAGTREGRDGLFQEAMDYYDDHEPTIEKG